MSLFQQGGGLSSGTLGGLGVVGCRSLGNTSSSLRVSDPFPFTAPSLSYSAPPFELQPHVHRGWLFHSSAGEGGYRTCSSFPRLLHPRSTVDGVRYSGDRPLAPQRLGGCLPFPHGDCPVRSSVSLSVRLDGIPGSPRCLPPGSGPSIFSTVSEVLRGRIGLPVLRPLLLPVDSSAGVYSRHGPGLFDHASPQVPNPPVPRRLACSGLLFSRDCAGEGFSAMALSATWDSDQHSQELTDSDSIDRLFRDEDTDFSFEGFPDPQADPEAVLWYRLFSPIDSILCRSGANFWG